MQFPGFNQSPPIILKYIYFKKYILKKHIYIYNHIFIYWTYMFSKYMHTTTFAGAFPKYFNIHHLRFRSLGEMCLFALARVTTMLKSGRLVWQMKWSIQYCIQNRCPSESILLKYFSVYQL